MSRRHVSIMLLLPLFGLFCFLVGKHFAQEDSGPFVCDLKLLRDDLSAFRQSNYVTSPVFASEATAKPVEKESPAPVQEETCSFTPGNFDRFRVCFEVCTRESQDQSYVNKQAKGLKGLVTTIPSVKGVSVLSIEGADDKGRFYPLMIE